MSLRDQYITRLENRNAELVKALKAFQNCGLIATTGRTLDGRPSNCTCHVHAELADALAGVNAVLAS